MLDPDKPESISSKRLCYPRSPELADPANAQTLLDSNRLSRHEPADLTTCTRLVVLDRNDLLIADIRLGQQAIRLSGIDAT